MTEDSSDKANGEQKDERPPEVIEQQFQSVRQFAEKVQREIRDNNQQSLQRESLDTFDSLRRDYLTQRHVLRSDFAKNLRRLLLGQIIVADVVFIIYAWVGMKWRIPATVISAWLGALVVQVISVVAIVVKGIFPIEEADFSSPHAPSQKSDR